MGLSLEFLIGDVEVITSAVRRLDLEALWNPSIVKQRADLSLHLSPQDLNFLSEEFGRASGQIPCDFRSNLKILVDDEDLGLLLVDEKWVEYAAKVSAESIFDLVEKWMERMRREYDDTQIEASDDSREAVGDLVQLCQNAKRGGNAVLHYWYL